MAVRIEHVDDVAVVIADGRFIVEEQVDELEAALTQLLRDGGPRKILVDMSRMEFLRSISIGVISVAHAAAIQRGTRLWLCGMNARNRSAFDLMKFDDKLEVFDTQQDALDAFQQA